MAPALVAAATFLLGRPLRPGVELFLGRPLGLEATADPGEVEALTVAVLGGRPGRFFIPLGTGDLGCTGLASEEPSLRGRPGRLFVVLPSFDGARGAGAPVAGGREPDGF